MDTSQPLSVTPPEIPGAALEFAKEIAAIAKSHDIKSFTMTVRLHSAVGEQRFHGDLRTRYSAYDGRGRPCDNLSVEVDTVVRHDISSTPSSSS